jgi:hypothetical protein
MATELCLLKEGTPIKFYYGCSDVPTSYEVFYSGDTLGYFHDEMELLGAACRDLRVLIPNSKYRFNLVTFFFFGCGNHICVPFNANHLTKVSSLANEIESFMDDDEFFRDFFRNFLLKGIEIIDYDKEVDKRGLGGFLQYNTEQDNPHGIVQRKPLDPKLWEKKK